MSIQGRSTSDLIWVSPFGIYGSYLGLASCVLGLIAQPLSITFPVRGENSIRMAVQGSLWLSIIIGLNLSSSIYYTIKEGWNSHPVMLLDHIDLSTGFRNKQQLLMTDELYAEERNRKLGLFGWQEGITWQERARFCVEKPAGRFLVMWLNMRLAWQNAGDKFRTNWQAHGTKERISGERSA